MFSVSAIKQFIFNIFMLNLPIMCTSKCITNLFEKIATSLHHGLDRDPEPFVSLSHGVHHEVGHHLRDFDHQQGGGVVGGFVKIPLTKLHKSRRLQSVVGQRGDAVWAWACIMRHEHAA
jgi:hypothetical protein